MTVGDGMWACQAMLVKRQKLRIAQLYANDQRISRATTNRSEESVSGSHTTVAKSAYYTRLWASFFVKLREKIPGRGLRFFGLILKNMVACLGNLTSDFVSLFVFAVFSNALIDTLSARS